MMRLKLVATAALFMVTGLAVPVKAQESRLDNPANSPTAQSQTTAEQVLTACVENRAETLPIPFTDLSPTHWAFKAVMTMYYCGAYRQATPPALYQRLIQQQPTQTN